MQEERCQFKGDCDFRNKCACNGNKNLLCKVTYQAGGIIFVDKLSHPACVAKTSFGDAHICICPAKANNPYFA